MLMILYCFVWSCASGVDMYSDHWIPHYADQPPSDHTPEEPRCPDDPYKLVSEGCAALCPNDPTKKVVDGCDEMCPNDPSKKVADGCDEQPEEEMCPNDPTKKVSEGCDEMCPNDPSKKVSDGCDEMCPNDPTKKVSDGCDEMCPNDPSKKVSDGCEPEAPPSLKGVHFDNDKSTLRPESYAILDHAIEVLKGKTTGSVWVEGHTDSNASDEYNQGLSERRANTVKQYLLKGGITQIPLEARGFGESRPIDTNATPEGRFNNRRVELSFHS